MIDGPDSQYKMMWGGTWRAVTNMLDHAGQETSVVTRATRVVLYAGPQTWIATVVMPGDLIERDDRDPNAREWEMLNT